MEDWIKGDAVLLIDFIHTYKKDDKTQISDFFHFNPDETLN